MPNRHNHCSTAHVHLICLLLSIYQIHTHKLRQTCTYFSSSYYRRRRRKVLVRDQKVADDAFVVVVIVVLVVKR